MVASRRRTPLLLPVLILVAALGCGSDDSPTEPDPGPDLTVAAVTVTPDAVAFSALGDTARFIAEAFNAAGDPVPGAFAWTSTEPAVVTVDTAGLAECQAVGTAAVIATADGFADTAQVTVTLTTFAWNAADDGDWHDPARWRGGAVPAAGDTALITVAGDYTVTLDDDADVAKLVLGAGVGQQRLETAVNTLTLGTFVLDGATLDIDGAVNVDQAMTWRGGSITGPGMLSTAVGVELALGGGSPIPELSASLTNHGTLAMVSSARVDIPAGGYLDNPAGAVIDFRSDGAILPYAGGLVTSSGTLRKSGGVGVAAFGTSSGEFVCHGPVEVASGSLRIAGGEVRGTVDITPPGRLEALGAITFGSDVAFTDHGALDIAGSVTMGDESGGAIAIPYLTLNSGSVGGEAAIAVSDSLVWVRGTFTGSGEITAASVRMVGDSFTKNLIGRTLRVSGELFTGSGLDLLLDEGAAILMEETGHWRQGFAGEVRQVAAGGGSLQMAGTFSKEDDEETLLDLPVVFAGPVLLRRGVLTVTDTFTLAETGLLRGGGQQLNPGDNLRLDLTEAVDPVLGGIIEPDFDGRPGWLDIAGEAVMTTTTEVRIDLAVDGDLRGERLIFSDAITMDGTLAVILSLDPDPLGETFVVVSTLHGHGTFHTVTGADDFEIDQDTNGVRLHWPPE